MSSERSPVVRNLFKSLNLPDGVAGQLDWVSGVYRINRTASAWRRYFENPNADRDLTITLFHEWQHFMQVSAFSYLHYFVTLTYHAIAGVVTACYNNLATLPERLQFDRNVRDAVWDLQWKEDGGVSVLEMVESLTFFIENNQSHSYHTQTYLDLLARASVPNEYKNGFLYFVEKTQRAPNLAALFPAVCHMALCSRYPRNCFDLLAVAIRSGRLTANTSFPDLVAFCEQEDEHHWGFAWDWRRGVGGSVPLHPIFGSLETAIDRDESLRENFVRYVLSPHRFFDPFVKLALAPPIVFNPELDPDAPGFNEWPIDVGLALRGAALEEKRKRTTWLLYLAVASRKYFGRFGSPPQGFGPVET